MIHCSNPKAQYIAHKDEIDAAIRTVLEKGRYILGDEVERFETEFSQYIGVRHGVGVGSGTEAIHLALQACGVGAGDEVITVSHTAVATVAAISLSGARPVLVDVDPVSFTMDPARLEEAFTPRTKAIIPVHIYGHPARIDAIAAIARKRGVSLIEDCAQAHGAAFGGKRVGSFGDAGCFSFYPTKNLGAIGDAGMIVTDNGDLADKLRLLRQYGWAERFVSKIGGMNSRLDEMQAAILRVKLRYLDSDNAARREIADFYKRELSAAPIELPSVAQGCAHVYHQFVIRAKTRDRLLDFLRGKEIEAGIHYPTPVHRQPAYLGTAAELPVTERLAKEILSLPIYPELSVDDATAVARAIKDFFVGQRAQ